jgi:hypothetical protein
MSRLNQVLRACRYIYNIVLILNLKHFWIYRPTNKFNQKFRELT